MTVSFWGNVGLRKFICSHRLSPNITAIVATSTACSRWRTAISEYARPNQVECIEGANWSLFRIYRKQSVDRVLTHELDDFSGQRIGGG